MAREYKTLTLSDYTITEDGRVINNHSGRTLKGQANGKGYLRVTIGHKFYFVHRLVAEKYVPNPENKPQVNHKDGNKINNHCSNLEWVTNGENRKHAVRTGLHLSGEKSPCAKLKKEDVEYIRQNRNVKRKELAEKYNVSVSTISDIWNNRTWKND